MVNERIRYCVHRFLLPVISRAFPEKLLMLLHKHWPVDRNPYDGWTLWLDASYYKYTRRERKREQECQRTKNK